MGDVAPARSAGSGWGAFLWIDDREIPSARHEGRRRPVVPVNRDQRAVHGDDDAPTTRLTNLPPINSDPVIRLDHLVPPFMVPGKETFSASALTDECRACRDRGSLVALPTRA